MSASSAWARPRSARATCSWPVSSAPTTARGRTPTTCARSTASLRYSQGTADDGFSVTGMAYSNKWNATDQVPQRAIIAGDIGLYGEEDPTDGGNSDRFSLSARYVAPTHRLLESQCLPDQERARSVQQLHLFPDQSDPGRPVPSARRPRPVRRQCIAHAQWRDRRTADRDEPRHPDPRGHHRSRPHRHVPARVPGEHPQRQGERRQRRHLYPEHGSLDTVVPDDPRLARRLFCRHCRLDLRREQLRQLPSRDRQPEFSAVWGPFYKTEFFLGAGMGMHSNDARGTTITEEPVDRIAIPVHHRPTRRIAASRAHPRRRNRYPHQARCRPRYIAERVHPRSGIGAGLQRRRRRHLAEPSEPAVRHRVDQRLPADVMAVVRRRPRAYARALHRL